jgi:hypothetical protein
MTHTIFFSWQLDTRQTEGRNLIEGALKRALRKIAADTTLEEAVRELAVDKDTQNVPGSPPIVETILKKIDAAAIFVPDLTFVGARQDGRPTPNPNVLIEYGYALKSLGHGRMVPVMNIAHGAPSAETLPFDLLHLRHPIKYSCPEGADDAERGKARDDLAKNFEKAIRTILQSPEFQHAIMPAAPAEPHPHDVKLLGEVRALLSPSLQTFLARHNFGNQFPIKILSPLHNMVDDWVGVAHRFHDPQVQEAFGRLMTATSLFVELVSERIFADARSMGIGSPLTDRDRREGMTETTREGIRAMNDAASALVLEIERFEIVARDRIRV